MKQAEHAEHYIWQKSCDLVVHATEERRQPSGCAFSEALSLVSEAIACLISSFFWLKFQSDKLKTISAGIPDRSALHKMHAVDSEIESLLHVTKERAFLFLSPFIFQQVLQFVLLAEDVVNALPPEAEFCYMYEFMEPFAGQAR